MCFLTLMRNVNCRWVSVLNNSRTEALEKAFGDSDKAEVTYFNTLQTFLFLTILPMKFLIDLTFS